MGLKKKHLAVLSVVLAVFLSFSGCTTEEDAGQNQADDSGETDGGATDQNESEDFNETGFVVFDYPPFDLEKVAYILPMGLMTGAHVTPIDHQYYVSYDFNLGNDAAVDIEVYSPGDGIVTSIQHMSVAAGDSPMPVDDFRLIIQHSTTISSMYIHIDELSEKIAEFDPGLGEYASVNIEVSAGEVIGRYGGSVDYNIADEGIILPFINPESYEREPWKIHCVDPFDYFNESIKNTMVEKSLRTKDPVGGEICYDVDGRLVGTWFEEGTNGYEGVDPDRYWAGHLSIVYDSIDPNAIVVSIGTFIDTAQQFTVKGNSPDPANISVDDGLVIYELVDSEYVKNDTVWDGISLVKGLKVQNTEYVQGVILLQLIEDRKLKVEIFPNQTVDEVSVFTDDFNIYVR